MKNIHVIPTDKPSRLQLQMNGNFHIENGQIIALRSYENIYITSDEEIKEGDWALLNDRLVVRYFKPRVESKSFKKIILTTDQYLIRDGVQAIDDEFLEWFVKNPSCEWVEVTRQGTKVRPNQTGFTLRYFISIPTEELEHRWVGALVDENIEDIYEPYRCETKDLYTGNDCLPSFETKEECQAWCDSNNKKVEIKKENHNYLQGFINQFEEGGEHQEISNNDWTVSSFLQWLQLNNFKIIKIDNKE